jgi:hypothetical protein
MLFVSYIIVFASYAKVVSFIKKRGDRKNTFELLATHSGLENNA